MNILDGNYIHCVRAFCCVPWIRFKVFLLPGNRFGESFQVERAVFNNNVNENYIQTILECCLITKPFECARR